ncbi:unnamed protein product [Diatraea saccharalis]|uniref:Regulatory protein zeste n=1 Tax=Diatraea saccharalis TaxID=40085 RepID=A0A9N9WEG0_9NEOP|nr:unnamed protein product [Diatraea saccharalis]
MSSTYSPDQWRLFIDSSKISLKAVLLHNGNEFPSVPLAHGVHLEALLEFVERHRDLALGRVRFKEARALADRLWRECAELLNPLEPARTGKEWAKVWNHRKCRVRAKLVQINSSHSATGGGPSNALTLTPLEERIANIIRRDVGPLLNVRQDQFAHSQNPIIEDHNNYILLPPLPALPIPPPPGNNSHKERSIADYTRSTKPVNLRVSQKLDEQPLRMIA